MNNREYWMKKRMEDIPKPIKIGEVNLTKEQQKKAENDLMKLILESKKYERK